MKPLRLAAVSALATAGAVLAASATATAVPAVGLSAPAGAKGVQAKHTADFPVSADDVRLSLCGEDLSLDLTGRAHLTLGVPKLGDPDVPASGGFSMTGSHPKLGKVIVETESEGTATRHSALAPFPAELHMLTRFTVTLHRPDCFSEGSRAQDPLVLTGADPGTLTGTVSGLPPTGRLYQLQNPVDLLFPETHEPMTAQKPGTASAAAAGDVPGRERTTPGAASRGKDEKMRVKAGLVGRIVVSAD